MKRWLNTLSQSGTIDRMYKERDYNVLGDFIKIETSQKLVKLAKACRDCSLASEFSASQLIKRVDAFIDALTSSASPVSVHHTQRNYHGEPLGQSVRYRETTRKIYAEKLHFAGGVALRTMDVTMEDSFTSKKVRRIVEKRMSQACHRQSKGFARGESNHYRQDLRRALSYQLQNLGQVEDMQHRGVGTHWKHGIDAVSGLTVMKQKHSYNTMEEAVEKANLYMARHPKEKIPMVAYKCAHCGKYHIGHDYVSIIPLISA